jgi:thymidine kinase
MKIRYSIGAIELITGPMFAGKSEELIRRLKKLIIAGFKTQVFKPEIDDRYSVECISSHNKSILKAQNVSSTKDILNSLDADTEVIGIDEVQFLDSDIVEFLDRWADSGKIAIVSGLDLDFKCEPFLFSDKKLNFSNLMVISDTIIKLTAICMFKEENGICGLDATRSQRLIEGKPASYFSELVMVSASELYEPRCRKHHCIPDKPEMLEIDFFKS